MMEPSWKLSAIELSPARFTDLSLDDLDLRTPTLDGTFAGFWRNSTSPSSAHGEMTLLNETVELDAESEAEGAAAEPLPRMSAIPLAASSITSFDDAKEIIHDMYMTKNMNLRDVIAIMSTEFHFKATARMYKRQFSKWGWHKYDSRQYRRSLGLGKNVRKMTGRSCTRVMAGSITKISRQRQGQESTKISQRQLLVPLLHENTDSQHFHALLGWLRQYLQGCAEPDSTRAVMRKDGSLFRPSAFQKSMQMSCNALRAKDYGRGGANTRVAFRHFEACLRQPGPNFVLVWDVISWAIYFSAVPDMIEYRQLAVQLFDFGHGMAHVLPAKRHLVPLFVAIKAVWQVEHQRRAYLMSSVRILFDAMPSPGGPISQGAWAVMVDCMDHGVPAQEQESINASMLRSDEVRRHRTSNISDIRDNLLVIDSMVLTVLSSFDRLGAQIQPDAEDMLETIGSALLHRRQSTSAPTADLPQVFNLSVITLIKLCQSTCQCKLMHDAASRALNFLKEWHAVASDFTAITAARCPFLNRLAGTKPSR